MAGCMPTKWSRPGTLHRTYDFLSRSDPEMLRILNDDILLLAPINPDGMELVSNWYMRAADPKQRTMNGLRRLYQKYVGHDNNRDSYIANQPETEAVNRQMYVEWIPQIMYNSTRPVLPARSCSSRPSAIPSTTTRIPSSPSASISSPPPYTSASSPKANPAPSCAPTRPTPPGSTAATAPPPASTTKSACLPKSSAVPRPQPIPMIATKLLAAADQPAPSSPRQEWHQRQSIDYLVSSDRGILDIPSKYREDFLFRIYRAGKNSIERGSRDTWTLTPKHIAAVEAAYAKEQAVQGGGVFFANSPAFRLLPDAGQKRTRTVASYAGAEPLRSGWAWGQQYLNGAVAIAESDVGERKVYFFGPEITFRGQAHGTFKFLFNAIQLSAARSVTLP